MHPACHAAAWAGAAQLVAQLLGTGAAATLTTSNSTYSGALEASGLLELGTPGCDHYIAVRLTTARRHCLPARHLSMHEGGGASARMRAANAPTFVLFARALACIFVPLHSHTCA